MTKLETYADMMRIVDVAICNIQTEGNREGALKAIKTAYNYAVKNAVVPREEAKRSADHRRKIIAQWYPEQLPEELPDEESWKDDLELDCSSLDHLAELEYEKYS